MEIRRIKIGISYTNTNYENYRQWFAANSEAEEVELVELSFTRNNLEDIHTCDGFVLTGGVDIHPFFYNGDTDYPNAPETFEIERDRFEKRIYDYSQQHRLPLLAICRGLQLMNVLNGGKLIQDFGEANATHKKEAEEDKLHHVHIASGSLLREISGEENYETNSAHHQAVDPSFIGRNLMVNCQSEVDGLIEGLEWKDKTRKSFFLGVQWHPERIKDRETHPLSQKIKERFLQEVKMTHLNKLAVVNPATEEVIVELNEDNRESIEEKLRLLKAGQKAWQAVPLEDRVQVLQQFAERLKANTERLAAVLTSEVGKPLQQS
ncbi:MAG TPA: aldehyde dehydrogenase family protein, partial [Flavisolibacter sp.]|nr:aldehyde dehydrogenase family protein [Flavisolibacter sp.]